MIEPIIANLVENKIKVINREFSNNGMLGMYGGIFFTVNLDSEFTEKLNEVIEYFMDNNAELYSELPEEKQTYFKLKYC